MKLGRAYTGRRYSDARESVFVVAGDVDDEAWVTALYRVEGRLEG